MSQSENTGGATDGQSESRPVPAETPDPSAAPRLAAKATRKRAAGTATKKTQAAAKPRKTSSPKKASSAAVSVSDEDIRLRAYFIAEKRARQGGTGDSSTDWLEARRQLLAEAAGRA